MAKITLANGITIEGTAEELAVLMAQMTAKPDVVETEEVAEDDTLKVGDYAKVVVRDPQFNRAYKVGDIVKITKVDGSTVPYSAGKNGSNECWFSAEHLTKATEEEVASSKAQAEADAIERKRNAVFTDAGRKVNEYRKGDVVRIVSENSGSENATNDIGVITEIEFDDVRIQVNGKLDYGNWSYFPDIEPIVFVENRLDRN